MPHRRLFRTTPGIKIAHKVLQGNHQLAGAVVHHIRDDQSRLRVFYYAYGAYHVDILLYDVRGFHGVVLQAVHITFGGVTYKEWSDNSAN